MTRAVFEAEAANAQAQALGADAYDNEAFLEHYSGLAPLDQNWDEEFDSDETPPPTQQATPPPPPQATTTAAPQDAGMS